MRQVSDPHADCAVEFSNWPNQQIWDGVYDVLNTGSSEIGCRDVPLNNLIRLSVDFILLSSSPST